MKGYFLSKELIETERGKVANFSAPFPTGFVDIYNLVQFIKVSCALAGTSFNELDS